MRIKEGEQSSTVPAAYGWKWDCICTEKNFFGRFLGRIIGLTWNP